MPKKLVKHHDAHGGGDFWSELAVPFKIMANGAKDTYDFVKPALPLVSTIMALAGDKKVRKTRAKKGEGIIDDIEHGFKKVTRKGKKLYEDAKPIIDFAKDISPVAIPLAKYMLGLGDHVKLLHARLDNMEKRNVQGGAVHIKHEDEPVFHPTKMKQLNQDNSTTATRNGYLPNQQFNPIANENKKKREFLRENGAKGSSYKIAGDDELDYGGDYPIAGKNKVAQKRISRGKGIIGDIVNLL